MGSKHAMQPFTKSGGKTCQAAVGWLAERGNARLSAAKPKKGNDRVFTSRKERDAESEKKKVSSGGQPCSLSEISIQTHADVEHWSSTRVWQGRVWEESAQLDCSWLGLHADMA